MIFRLKGERRYRLPSPYAWYDGINDTQKDVIGDIALNGPIDAYRASKRIDRSLTATQVAIKKFVEEGVLQLKEIVQGDTQQNRKIYSLTVPGFCLVVPFMLNREWSECTYEDVRRLIAQYPEYFPELFNNWESVIVDIRTYFKKNHMDLTGNSRYLIAMPDAPTHLLCDILYRICDQQHALRQISEINADCLSEQFVISLLDDATNASANTDIQEFTFEKIKEGLSKAITGDPTGSIVEAEFYAIRRQTQLWDMVEPGLRFTHQRLKAGEILISKLLKQ
jgi:hypothetical protein